MMNLKKRIAVIASACVMLNLTVSSVNASLWSYKKGDIDDNGSVNQSDKASMQQVLHGYKYPDATTIERLDLNRDYVIDAYDRTLLSNILSGSMSTSTVFYEFTDSLPGQSSRSYYICSPTTGAVIPNSSYTLPLVSNLQQASSPRTVFDGDDRYAEDGFDGVINVQYSNGANAGTAFAIDSHTLLTAAHVVYNKSGLKFKIFTDHDTQSNIPITPVAYHVPSEYVNNNNICYDYAIVTVEEDLECYNGYGYEDYSFINFDLGLMRNEMSLSKPVYVTGFGGDGVITPELEDVKSTGVGTLLNTSNTDTDYRIYFDTDIVPGNSGSPVYIKNPDGSNSVIGICTHQSTYSNSGIRITSDILKFVFNNSHL